MRARIVCLLLAALAVGLLPASSALAQGSGFHASVDWLNWKARRSGMDFVIVDPNAADGNVQGNQVDLNYDRGNGARLVLGYDLGSRWDVSLGYQTFSTNDQLLVTQPVGGELWGTRLHPRSWMDPTSVAARATLDYDVLDLMLSRRFAMDSCQSVDFTLFGGFRYAMIDQTLNINYVDNVNVLTTNISSPTKLDGYGIRAGGQLDWNVRGGFSLFGKGALSVLAARIDSTYSERDVSGGNTTYPFAVSSTYYQAVPVIETALGMSYQRGPWEVAFGYEMAFWANAGERRDPCDDIDDQKFSCSSNDLVLDGFFLRFAFSR